MATTVANFSLSTPRVVSKLETPSNPKQAVAFPYVKCCTWKKATLSGYGMHVRTMASASSSPRSLSDQIAESVKKAEETCAGDTESGECAAAWDEVEEVSAAASHMREKQKNFDPLEDYCKDNPETEECRTYED